MKDKDISEFSQSVHKNTIWNILLRGIGILLGLVMLRINILYLGASFYGLWVTIASISQWANIGDLGIGNGLRNELTKAIANGDFTRQKSLIKTAIIMLSRISIFLFFILTLVSEALIMLNILDWTLRIPLYITNGFFCLSFILGIARTIAYSYQKSWFASLAQTSTTAFQILGVLLLLLLSIQPNLVIFAIFSGVASILGNLVIVFSLYRYIKSIMPISTVAIYDKNYRHAILNVGMYFFVLQVCCLILYATDNIIINKLFDSASVAKYSVITTVYNTGDSLFSLLLISLWSAVTYVAEKQNYSWIRNEINTLLRMWGIFSIGVIIVSVFFNIIIQFWLGDSGFYYEPRLVLVFALFTICNSFGAIYVNIANGLGVIKLQMVCSVFGSIINIPLSIFLATTCNMGLSGIKLATIICCLGSMFLVPLQIHRLLLNKNKIQE